MLETMMELVVAFREGPYLFPKVMIILVVLSPFWAIGVYVILDKIGFLAWALDYLERS